MKEKRRIIKTIIIISIVIATVFIGLGVYVSDYYHADIVAINEFTVKTEVKVEVSETGNLIYMPKEPIAGFIFYPGGKVEYKAYEPLMKALASKGILCVLVEMPFNLAVLDMNAADGIQKEYPDVEKWYIGGHSLGGSMAASYLLDNVKSYEGLILLGSYSTVDLSGEAVECLSIYGSEDRVINKENYDANKSKLPKNFTEYIIEGGCHAYFGMYGEQDKDGKATITNVQQIDITAEKIAEFVGKE